MISHGHERAGQLRARLTAVPVLALSRQLPRVGATRTVLLAASVLTMGLLPALLAVSFGHLVSVVAGGRHGLGDQALLVAVIGIVLSFLGMQLSAPAVYALAESLGRRMASLLQIRVIGAVTRPTTIVKLEDNEVRDQITAARSLGIGQVSTREAVIALGNITTLRLQAIAAGAVLAWFSAWMAALITLAYLQLTWVLASEYRHNQEAAYGRPGLLRRANYIRDLALTGSAAKEVRIFGLSAWLDRAFTLEWSSGLRSSQRRARLMRVCSVSILAGAHALLLIRLGLVAEAGAISVSDLAMYASALASMAGVLALTMDLVYLHQGSAAVPAALWVEEHLADPPGSQAGEAPAPPLPLPVRTIKFNDVSFRYPGSTRWVLRNFNLEISVGDSLAIVGFNGAGKTTLIKLLCGLYEPCEGYISLDDRRVVDFDPHSWQRMFSVVFQTFNRYPLSLADNIAFGAPDHPPDKLGINAAAMGAGLSSLVSRLPDGYDTVLSRRYPGGVDLSGGQWQRVAVARALYAVQAGARVLVLDEPTAALDVRGEAEFYDTVVQQADGLTTLLVSHRFATVRRARRIVVLDGGCVVEDGTHDELLVRGGLYARMFTIQAERFDVC